MTIRKYDWTTNSELLKLMVYTLADELTHKNEVWYDHRDEMPAEVKATENLINKIIGDHFSRAANVYNFMIDGDNEQGKLCSGLYRGRLAVVDSVIKEQTSEI